MNPKLRGWTLLRELGRIGSPGCVVIEPSADENDAVNAGAEIETAKRRRGCRNQVNRIGGR
jgi:predicted DNA-binding WGR domain protein